METHSIKINFSLPVSFLKEGKYFVAYTPALDISTSGKTFEEAKKRFGEVVVIFFEELLQKGTLDKVLTELGWRKVQKTWSPPILVASEIKSFSIPLQCPS